jgi:hypothetical protein
MTSMELVFSRSLDTAGPTGGDGMLSREDNRRLAQLERQVRRADPEFYDRMTSESSRRRRRPLLLAVMACVIWPGAVVLCIFGRWIPAAIAAVGATVLVALLAYTVLRRRPPREEC